VLTVAQVAVVLILVAVEQVFPVKVVTEVVEQTPEMNPVVAVAEPVELVAVDPVVMAVMAVTESHLVLVDCLLHMQVEGVEVRMQEAQRALAAPVAVEVVTELLLLQPDIPELQIQVAVEVDGEVLLPMTEVRELSLFAMQIVMRLHPQLQAPPMLA
jgi:hypothetical protein